MTTSSMSIPNAHSSSTSPRSPYQRKPIDIGDLEGIDDWLGLSRERLGDIRRFVKGFDEEFLSLQFKLFDLINCHSASLSP